MISKFTSKKTIWVISFSFLIILCVIVIAIVCFVFFFFPQSHKSSQGSPQIRNISEIQGLSVVWSRNDMFARYNFGDSLMVSTNGVVAIKGVVGYSRRFEQLITISGDTNQILWSDLFGFISSLDANDSGIFAGTRYGVAIKYDPRTGNVIWSKNISNLRTIYHLQVIDDQVYIYSLPGDLSILESKDGTKVDYEISPALENIFLVSNDIVYAGGIKAVNSKTGELIWERPLEEAVYETPSFVEDQIFVRTGRFSGYIYSIDRSSGQILWRSEQEIVSNISVTDATIYALSTEGEIQCYNRETGNGKLLARVEPSPLDYTKELPSLTGGYYVSVDESNRQIYVLLGDTFQLFAFKILDDKCQ